MERISITLAMIAALALALTGVCERPAAAYQPFTSAANVPFTWNTAAGPVRWRVQAGAPAIVRESMLYSIHKWSEATSGALAFEEGDGGVLVEWDTDGTSILDVLYLAYTTFNVDDTSRITTARIVVNAKTYGWQRGGYTGVGPVIDGRREANLDSVMLHELGHVIGLDHSDKNPGAIVGVASSTDLPTMNSIIYPGAESLHTDDETGARALYNAGAPAPEPAPPAFTVWASPASGRAPLKVYLSTSANAPAAWDFGDGTSDTGIIAGHKFTTPGVYTVTASINGESATVQIEVEKRGKKARKLKREKKQKTKAQIL